MMTIDILYHEACTHYPRTIQDVQHVLAEEGIEADVRVIDLTNEKGAQRRSYAGSPTIIINGEDIEPGPQQDLGHMRGSCRVYHHEGKLLVTPHKELIRNAVRKHRT
jgi:hypothetical protein